MPADWRSRDMFEILSGDRRVDRTTLQRQVLSVARGLADLGSARTMLSC